MNNYIILLYILYCRVLKVYHRWLIYLRPHDPSSRSSVCVQMLFSRFPRESFDLSDGVIGDILDPLEPYLSLKSLKQTSMHMFYCYNYVYVIYEPNQLPNITRTSCWCQMQTDLIWCCNLPMSCHSHLLPQKNCNPKSHLWSTAPCIVQPWNLCPWARTWNCAQDWICGNCKIGAAPASGGPPYRGPPLFQLGFYQPGYQSSESI